MTPFIPFTQINTNIRGLLILCSFVGYFEYTEQIIATYNYKNDVGRESMANKNILRPLFVVIFLTILIVGCAVIGPGPIVNMRVLSADQAITKPSSGKALVVFARTSGNRNTTQSSVFHIKGDKLVILGNVAAMKKISYQFEPGEHLFMVVSENADFMTAKLEANKTYYADIEPRIGWARTRYSFIALTDNDLKNPEMQKALANTQWVEKIRATEQWAEDNMKSIKQKYHVYYDKWKRKSESGKPHLGEKK